MSDKVMSYSIKNFILVDYPIQHVHKAWLQQGSSTPVSSQVPVSATYLLAQVQESGLCCLLFVLLLLLALCRSQECKNTAGALVVTRRCWDKNCGRLKALRSTTVN